MKILGIHIPGTRDKDKEIAYLQQELAKADEVAKDLRAQNHALRLDIREYHQAVDRWMAHYDELARDAQRLRLEAMNQRQHGKDHSQAQTLDPLQQIQELAGGKTAELARSERPDRTRKERQLPAEARKNGDRKEQTQEQAQGLCQSL